MGRAAADVEKLESNAPSVGESWGLIPVGDGNQLSFLGHGIFLVLVGDRVQVIKDSASSRKVLFIKEAR
jgi:hypothetical protein